MGPKMTTQDAAQVLGTTKSKLEKLISNYSLDFYKSQGASFFGYETAEKVFNFDFQPQTIAFQIVKGGTGKTSLAHEFAVRANLYGARVLCIDLDQQGNLTHAFGVDANQVPIVVDILAEGYSYQEAIVRVSPGLDIVSSRIENALIDDVIRLKKLQLEKVYGAPFAALKKQYDLIVVDCPPNLGQSVASVTLASDLVVCPVTPEQFALSGLQVTSKALKELEESYSREIPFGIVLNKFDGRTIMSQKAFKTLSKHKIYQHHLLESKIRMSQEFPKSITKNNSIFNVTKATIAKTDIDNLTKELLGINAPKKKRVTKEALEEELAFSL